MTTPCYNTAQDIGDAADNCLALHEIVAATPSKEEHLLTTTEPTVAATPVISLSTDTTNVSYKTKPSTAEGIDWEYDVEAWGTDTAVTKVTSGDGSGVSHTEGYWVGIGLEVPAEATKLEFSKDGSGEFTKQDSLDTLVDSKKGFAVWPNVATATGKTIAYLVRWIKDDKVVCTNLYNIHVGEFKLADPEAVAAAANYAASPASVIAAAPAAAVAAVPTTTTTTSTKKTSTKKTTSTSTKASS